MSSDEKFYLGWQVGITYEAEKPAGNSLPKMLALLDEMAANGMNILSLMMTSYAYFDPAHDGFAWPVRNKRLECFRDKRCLNANAKTEFVSRVIEEAEKRGIEIQLFSNLAIYNPERIVASYPGACLQKERNGEDRKWLFCPDSSDVWQLENDETEDLLKVYTHRNVKSIAFERLSYSSGSCYCAASAEKFLRDTGKPMEDYGEGDALFDEWKVDSISKKISELSNKIKTVKPGMQVWLHSSCAPGWGHASGRLKAAGVDCVVPHVAHFVMDKAGFNTLLDRVGPNDTVLHFCVRDKALNNYNIWQKTPEIIEEIGEWALQYGQANAHLKGILFFNENTVSEENRAAVYRLMKKIQEQRLIRR